jgi:DNA-binding response OmpR family regulator
MGSSEEIRILIVDDDTGIRRLLRLLFMRQGWTVVAHADGECVVDEIATLNPDVVVLDLMLPKVSGFEVLKRLQAENPVCMKRIIVLTAVSTSSLGALTCEPDLWAVVRKPFDNTELVATVAECLRAHQSDDGNVGIRRQRLETTP